MARLPRPEPGGLTERYGLLAHAPSVTHAFLALYGRLWRDGIVDHPTKEVVRLRNARITDCGY